MKKNEKSGKGAHRRPTLVPGISVTEFRAYYWWKTELIQFARRLGLPAQGHKPQLSARIERRLQGLPDRPKPTQKRANVPRDSDRPLRRETRVNNYKSDDKTRAFFKGHIGPHFHFTYHLNQFRLAREGLTYGDLIDEWLAEYERRKTPSYQSPIASHGEYNRYIRDFFDDERNKGKSFQDAVASWNAIKHERGDRHYRKQHNPSRKR